MYTMQSHSCLMKVQSPEGSQPLGDRLICSRRKKNGFHKRFTHGNLWDVLIALRIEIERDGSVFDVESDARLLWN